MTSSYTWARPPQPCSPARLGGARDWLSAGLPLPCHPRSGLGISDGPLLGSEGHVFSCQPASHSRVTLFRSWEHWPKLTCFELVNWLSGGGCWHWGWRWMLKGEHYPVDSLEWVAAECLFLNACWCRPPLLLWHFLSLRDDWSCDRSKCYLCGAQTRWLWLYLHGDTTCIYTLLVYPWQ